LPPLFFDKSPIFFPVSLPSVFSIKILDHQSEISPPHFKPRIRFLCSAKEF